MVYDLFNPHKSSLQFEFFQFAERQKDIQSCVKIMDWNIPSTPPPPGVTSNFKNPESKGYESIIITTICLSLMTPVFALRLYSKFFVTRSLGWDDCKSERACPFLKEISFY